MQLKRSASSPSEKPAAASRPAPRSLAIRCTALSAALVPRAPVRECRRPPFAFVLIVQLLHGPRPDSLACAALRVIAHLVEKAQLEALPSAHECASASVALKRTKRDGVCWRVHHQSNDAPNGVRCLSSGTLEGR